VVRAGKGFSHWGSQEKQGGDEERKAFYFHDEDLVGELMMRGSANAKAYAIGTSFETSSI
jgi:hypothetical protein